MNTTLAGFVAVFSFFIFTILGASAQVYKLISRTKQWRRGELARDRICDGLHPLREMVGFTAFFLFAQSAITRTNIDFFILLSRIPLLILIPIILWFLKYHRTPRASPYFFLSLFGNSIMLITLICVSMGMEFANSIYARSVDSLLIVSSFFLFYGKSPQAFRMYRDRRSHAVSWLRELGLVIKDICGLWYSVSVGPELLWISLTHILSGLSSSLICIAKYSVEKRRASS